MKFDNISYNAYITLLIFYKYLTIKLYVPKVATFLPPCPVEWSDLCTPLYFNKLKSTMYKLSFYGDYLFPKSVFWYFADFHIDISILDVNYPNLPDVIQKFNKNITMYKPNVYEIAKFFYDKKCRTITDIAEQTHIAVQHVFDFLICNYTSMRAITLVKLLKCGLTWNDIFINGAEEKSFLNSYINYCNIMSGKTFSLEFKEDKLLIDTILNTIDKS